ncbi:MAG: polysaccharide deacetylase family protein [Nocardioidaceae bacterium]
MSGARVLGVAAAAAVVQLAPALTSVAPLRRAALPRLAGIGGRRHIALTYDDGPDPVSTPAFLGLLDAYDVRATFFLLGAHVEENRSLVREMAAAGHELAVHGWDHRCLAWKRPGRLADELRRTRDLVAEIGGRPVRWYRPPYGVLTAGGTARRAAGGTDHRALVRLGPGLVGAGHPGRRSPQGRAGGRARRHGAAARHRPDLGTAVLAGHAGGLRRAPRRLARGGDPGRHPRRARYALSTAIHVVRPDHPNGRGTPGPDLGRCRLVG